MIEKKAKNREPKERLKDYKEFHKRLPLEKSNAFKVQDVWIVVFHFVNQEYYFQVWYQDVHLHNLIPEWNDLVYRGKWDLAYERLNKTNPFP